MKPFSEVFGRNCVEPGKPVQPVTIWTQTVCG